IHTPILVTHHDRARLADQHKQTKSSENPANLCKSGDGASNGGTEAVNGLIELGRRIARGFRNFENYRLRMLLIAGGLDASTHTQL
ncbi:transposase, partial [Brevibacterium otitidis]